MPEVEGAALALPLVRRAVVPHGVVDHELVAALEQVQERDRAVRSDDLDRPVELHHRQPAAGRGEGVALTGVGLLADQELVTGGLPGGQVNDGRAAGQLGEVGSSGVVVMVSSVVSRAGQRRTTSTTVTRIDSRPGRNSSRQGAPSAACTDHVGLTSSQKRSCSHAPAAGATERALRAVVPRRRRSTTVRLGRGQRQAAEFFANSPTIDPDRHRRRVIGLVCLCQPVHWVGLEVEAEDL